MTKQTTWRWLANGLAGLVRMMEDDGSLPAEEDLKMLERCRDKLNEVIERWRA